MNTNQTLFPTSFLEDRISTISTASKVVYSADTNKTYNDIFSTMSQFLREETHLVREHRLNMRRLYPSLYGRGK